MFHSFYGLVNSINWPALHVWVFIAQLVEHCSANAEAMGLYPVDVLKILFSSYFVAMTTAKVKSSFHLYFRSSHCFIISVLTIAKSHLQRWVFSLSI